MNLVNSRLLTFRMSRPARSLNRSRKRIGVALAISLIAGAGAGVAQQKDTPQMPPVTEPLTPPTSRIPAAVAVLADYRYDDILWENDRTAHRIYGHALEAAEPPSGSGVDSWGKNVPWPFADRQLRHGHQHGFHGEGLDFYNVGTGRGTGGLGVWLDNKLWVSRNYVRVKIMQTGGNTADFEVSYAPWPVGVDRKVWETRRFTLPLGTHFTRMVSTISSDRPDPLVIGVGIGKRTTSEHDGDLTVDKARGLISWWGPEEPVKGRMMVALRVDPTMIVDVKEDFNNHLFLLKVMPGKRFVYYSGSAWDKGEGGFRTREAWETYARTTPMDFKAPRDAR